MFDTVAFLARLSQKTDAELLDMALRRADYQPEAVQLIWSELRARGLEEEADNSLAVVRELSATEAERLELYERERARILHKVDRGASLSFDLEDPVRLAFEEGLRRADIEFYTEDQAFDVAFDVRHRRHYYFARGDFRQAEQVLSDLAGEGSPLHKGRQQFLFFFVLFAILFLLGMLLVSYIQSTT